ncbi:protein FAN-like [Branchiostoma floridae x Branchiostoma belcheri]
MAFGGEGTEQQKERFSLLLLDPGEIYFEDFGVFYYTHGLPEEEAIRRKTRGRIKMCSKSLVFDPQDVMLPMLKFLLRSCTKIEKWQGPVTSRIDATGNVIMIESSQVYQMKEGNVIAPYVFKKKKEKYLFSLNFVMIEDVLPQMQQLLRASTLTAADQNSMIAAIVQSRQARVPFNTSWLETLYEKIVVEMVGDKIDPLVVNPGRIMITSSRLYFQPFNNIDPYPVLKIKLSDIKRIVKRRFLLRHVGVEIFCSEDGLKSDLFLTLKDQVLRDQLYDSIVSQSDVSLVETGQENATLRWQSGVMSNFDYLMYLNNTADRSFNDLTQYPVFPWVVADYTSSSLDLSRPETYRDLSKPIGALNPERLHRTLERYHDMPEPKFMYGSHYSTPGYVVYYLVRVAPEYMLCLQNGRFDQPDRMFLSIQETWKNVLTGASDVKELIPEFYQTSGKFLVNAQHLKLGTRQDGTKAEDVELPPWAADADDFVQKSREALESDYVSSHLHEWIDLIFGYKQRGEASENAYNVFYHLTYEGAVDLDSIADPNERLSLEAQIMEFGQTPKQLFHSPHPQRFKQSPSTADSVLIGSAGESETPGVDAASSSAGVPTTKSCHLAPLWEGRDGLKPVYEHKLHKDTVTSVQLAPSGKIIFSVSQDSLMKMYSLEEQRQQRSISISNMALSSCQVMADSKTLIIGSWDNNVYIYSVEYGHILDTVLAHDDAVSCIQYQDGLLVSASWDSTVKLWECKIGGGAKKQQLQLLAELDHDSGVVCACVDAENTRVASGTEDGTLYIWSVESQYVLSRHTLHTGSIHAISFSAEGQRVLTCGADHYLRVLDVTTGTEVCAKDLEEPLRCMYWDGETVIVGGESGNVLVWDLVNLQPIARVCGHTGAVTCLHVSEDGRTIVTGGEDRKVCLWKLS